jgi:hypothetical protein
LAAVGVIQLPFRKTSEQENVNKHLQLIAGLISRQEQKMDWEYAEDRDLKQDEEKSPDELPCRRPQRGDFCHMTVMWAMNTAWHQHGNWAIFRDLPEDAKFEDVQEAVHRDMPETCPRPCPQDATEKTQKCKTAGPWPETQECYDKIAYAMEKDIKEHPSWYPFLGDNSSWEDVQFHLYHDPNTKKCPKPCDPKKCHTVSWADERPDYKRCMETLNWMKSTGRPEHPDWFPGLDEDSTDWDYQDHVAKDIKAEVYCPIPCDSDLDVE